MSDNSSKKAKANNDEDSNADSYYDEDLDTSLDDLDLSFLDEEVE